MTDVRNANEADLPRVAASLAKAFWDDPVMRYIFPEGTKDQERRLAGMMRIEAKSALRHETVWTAADGSANAIWKPPGKWKLGGFELLRHAPAMLSVLRSRIPKALAALNAIERKHPVDPPHWHLAVLGTEPEAQGKGFGSAVLQPVLERCDRDGEGAYLESSKERNVPFYERHGFRVTEEIQLPKDGPRMWLMWRDPQA